MRVLKAFYLSVLFTLAMGLFCGELPESLRLQDDTTNDFVADSSASAAREGEAPRESESAQKRVVARQSVFARMTATERHESPASLTEPSSPSGKELLELLSIRRT